MNFILDRFEDGGFVVLESPDGTTFSVPREWLPIDASEGDVLTARLLGEAPDTGSGGHDAIRLEIRLDLAATEDRRARARGIRDRLPRAEEGDIVL